MNRRTWIMIGIAVAVALVIGLVLKNRTSQTDGAQSQLPAESAQANYNVPPDIGMSNDNTGGLNMPMGNGGFTYSVSQGNSMPITPDYSDG